METPCTGVCVLDPVRLMCAGCLRTSDEIARCSSLSDAQRQTVMNELPRRHSPHLSVRGNSG